MGERPTCILAGCERTIEAFPRFLTESGEVAWPAHGLCASHRREFRGWEASDYEAEARGWLERAADALPLIARQEGDFYRAEVLLKFADAYIALARGRGHFEPFSPGTPLQPFLGYGGKPAEPA